MCEYNSLLVASSDFYLEGRIKMEGKEEKLIVGCKFVFFFEVLG